MIVTILLVIVNVITRKLFNYIIIWSEEIATSCFVYSVFIGAAYAYRKHQHVGVVCNVNIMIGGLTPPFGSMMFTCVSITGCKMQEFIKECVPFIIALLIALLLLTYIPGISMLIPNLIY